MSTVSTDPPLTSEPTRRLSPEPPSSGEVRRTVLDNGLTILTEEVPHVRSVTIGVWLKEGSRNERPEENGLAHFIEHLVFKGTERRTAREIAILTDSIGGALDAFTSREYACYFARVLDEHLDVAVDLLSDIILHPSFPPEEIDRERKVIFEEIRMVEDSPDELVYDLFYETIWGGHPLGRSIQGTEEGVARHTREDILRFFRGNYVAPNLLLCAAGRLRHEDLVEMVRARFAGLRGDGVKASSEPPPVRAGILERAKPDLEQVHLVAGTGAYPVNHPRHYALSLLTNVLGGGMSSRLFQKIREERGLAYSVYASAAGYSDAGNLTVYAATSRESVPEVLRLTGEEIRAIREEPVPEEELRRSKENLKGGLMLSLESTANRMANLARQELYFGRTFTPDEVLRDIDAVTAEEVREAARELLDPGRMSVVAVGKLDGVTIRREELAF